MDDDMMTWLKAEVKDIGKDTDKLLERGASTSNLKGEQSPTTINFLYYYFYYINR